MLVLLPFSVFILMDKNLVAATTSREKINPTNLSRLLMCATYLDLSNHLCLVP